MQYRKLGSTGLEVSVVGVGTWQFGGEWGRSHTQAEADEVLAAARECGINLIDTAGGSPGRGRHGPMGSRMVPEKSRGYLRHPGLQGRWPSPEQRRRR